MTKTSKKTGSTKTKQAASSHKEESSKPKRTIQSAPKRGNIPLAAIEKAVKAVLSTKKKK